jgi:DNA adenine methylase
VLKSQYCGKARYVEPFAGSAALFFAVKPQEALLADLNGHLINALRVLRDEPDSLHAELDKLPRDRETYYRVRREFNDLDPDGLDSAIRFVYLNRNSFNGLWRTNLRGEFNVPWGGSEMGDNPPLELLLASSSALRNAEIESQDFRVTLSGCGEGDFIYADPPYFTSNQRTFVEYGKRAFGQDDLNDLLDALRCAAERGAKIAMSYTAAMPLPLSGDWKRTIFEVVRNVAGFKGRRKREAEIMYTVGIVEDQ